MNILLILVIAEGVVLLSVISYLLFQLWKKKKHQTIELEVLLDSVKKLEKERKELLMQFLMDGHGQSSDDASESADYMIEAEKQFVQQFLKQQIEQSSVTSFYENLCELLDQYLYFVPKMDKEQWMLEQKIILEKESQHEAAVEEVLSMDDEEVKSVDSEQGDGVSESRGGVGIDTIAGSDVEQEDNVNDTVESEEEPDWGDAFSESGDVMDEEVKVGFDAEQESKVSDEAESEEEPDWGDAFSESGDVMDGDVKAGFEAEVDKK